MFGILTIIFDVLEEIIGKIIDSRYIAICPIIDKIIDIGRRLPQIISDFWDLSAKLSISKMTGKLSKNYRYWKKLLIGDPFFRDFHTPKCAQSVPKKRQTANTIDSNAVKNVKPVDFIFNTLTTVHCCQYHNHWT